MEKFHALPEEKQQVILQAAMGIFGAVGYKKAFVSDIAAAAGISKALVFHYFGTKKNLYLYLVQFAFARIKEAFAQEADPTVTDFFDRVRLATRIKMAFIAKYPALMQFAVSAYYETDPAVAEELSALSQESAAFRNDFVLTDIDRQKFKDTVDPALLIDLLVGYAEGFVGSKMIGVTDDFEAMLSRFDDILTMLRLNLYKEAFLDEYSH